MKRYYTSVFKYFIPVVILSTWFLVFSILNLLDFPEENRLYYQIMKIFVSLFMFYIGIRGMIHHYRIYKKDVYFEINESNIVFKQWGKKQVYEFTDVDHFIAKQSGKNRNLYIINIDTGKKLLLPISIFVIDYDEFLELLSKYSGKEVLLKNYGEELKPFMKTE